MVPEDDREDDAAEIARRARAAGHDAVGMRMHMGHEGEVRAVARFEEEGHAGDESEHGAVGVGVGETDGDEEGAGEDGEDVDEDLLAPDVGVAVDEVGDDAAEGPEDDVEEAEHGRPATGAGLFQGGEVFDVVGTQDGVDGQLGAKGAEVGACGHEGLRADNDRNGLFETGLDDDFAPRGVEHLLLADLRFMVVVRRVFASGFVADFLGATVRAARAGAVIFGAVHQAAGDIYDGAGNAVICQISFGLEMAVCPFARRGVGAEDKHGGGGGGDHDEGDDEGHTPGDMCGEMLILYKGVKDGRHKKVCDASTCVTEATCEGVGCADDVLVEEASRPYLTRNKATTKDTNKESEG